MVEPALHLIVPTALAAAFYPEKRKIVFALSPLTVTPDLDYYLGLHRGFSHSILFAAAASMSVYAAFHVAGGWTRRDAKTAALLALFYLSSHILLDMSPPGVPLMWPLSANLQAVDLKIYAAEGLFGLDCRVNTVSYSAEEASETKHSPVFTNAGAAAAAMALALTAAKYAGPSTKRLKADIIRRLKSGGGI